MSLCALEHGTLHPIAVVGNAGILDHPSPELDMRTTLLALALGTLIACGGGDSSTGASSHVGSYSLLSIDGDPVPSTILQAPKYLLEVINGSGSLNGDNTYSLSFTVRENDDGSITQVTVPSAGTYTRSGNAFTFHDVEGGVATGVFANNRMTVTDEDGVVYVYQKS
jgi:hypothetical protein